MKSEEQKKKIQFTQEYISPFLQTTKPKPQNETSPLCTIPTKLTKSQRQRLNAALDRAWANRDFEIDKYWSRATYFWAFIASTSVGYITVLTCEKLSIEVKTTGSFILACIGIIFSIAWTCVNLGSKKWQENWEKHIDMLEDYVTGPLYKTIITKPGYSVSKINLEVSKFISAIWILLAIRDLTSWTTDQYKTYLLIRIAFFLLTIYFVSKIVNQKDVTKKSKHRYFSFYRRENMDDTDEIYGNK